MCEHVPKKVQNVVDVRAGWPSLLREYKHVAREQLRGGRARGWEDGTTNPPTNTPSGHDVLKLCSGLSPWIMVGDGYGGGWNFLLARSGR